MFIDAHAHAAGPYAEPESILAAAQAYGIEKIVLCPGPKNNRELGKPPSLPVKAEPDSIYTLNRMLRFAYKYFVRANGDGNAYVCHVREALPDLILQFLWVNPLDLRHMSELESNIDRFHAKGIKLHQTWNAFAIDGSEFARLLEIAQSRGLPVFIHLYSKPETRKLVEFTKTHPKAVFILAHMLGVEMFDEERPHADNVYFDTSGSDRIRPDDIRAAINIFGHEHVIFGSDTPYADIADQLRKIDQLSLSADVKDHIMRLNIARLLSLPT